MLGHKGLFSPNKNLVLRVKIQDPTLYCHTTLYKIDLSVQ